MKKRFMMILLLTFVATTLAACGISTTTASSNNATTASTTAPATTTTAVTTAVTTLPVFNATTLATYNGNGGTTAYIAVNGVVYDVTDAPEWSNGWHKGMHLAGTDASAAFADSPHSLSFIQQLPVVGSYAD